MFDWQAGRLTMRAAGDGPRWRAVIAGDWAPRNGYETLPATDPEGIYGELRIVNVETVLGDEGTPIAKNGPHIKGDPAAIASLTAVPWDVATLCNNHVHDFGPAGLAATIDRLHAAGLQTCGAGATQAEAEAPLRLSVQGVPVAIVNCGEGEENRSRDGGSGVSGFDEERLAARVRDLRQTGHVVIVICHAGREYTPLPPPYVQRWYRRLADAGAHLVIGGHPHVPQGLEVRNGCAIAYSTGNFIFWMDGPIMCRRGYVVRAEFSGRDLCGLELVPYAAEPAGLRLIQGAEATRFFDALRRVSEPLADGVRAHWETYAGRRGAGMLNSVRAQLKLMEEDPAAGAENLRNFFETPAHSELILTWLGQIMWNTTGPGADWANALLDEWETREG